MTLSKQTKSNRENAKKSTGPKTEKGKNIVSQNGTTFGLFSKKLIIKSAHLTEDRVDYDLLIEDLRSEFKPQTWFQELLIRKIANSLWRSQRAVIAETAHINKQLENIDDKIEKEEFLHSFKMKRDKNLPPLDFNSPDSKELSDLIGVNSIPKTNFATKIMYYEMRLDRQLARTYDLLRRVQSKDELDKKEQQKKVVNDRNKPISL